MKWWWVILAAMAGVAALILVVGLLVPRSQQARVAVRLGKPPAEVWAVITDFGRQPEWNPEITASVPLPDRDGKAVWQETLGGNFKATMRSELLHQTAGRHCLLRDLLSRC